METSLCRLFYFILALTVFLVDSQPGGTQTFLDLFDGTFMIPGGIDNVPSANFDDPNLPVEFRQFIDSIPNNLDEAVPSRCQAPIEVGSCYGRSLRWAYDMQFRRCRPFFFRGCNGNQNNFRSRLSCELACSFRCNQNIDQGFCNADISRWGFNQFTGRCQEFTFGGCGGNTNRFTSERDCVETCGDVCLLPILRGPCDAQLPRWGYNFLTGQCQQFYFGGCQGNQNSYLTQEVCELACVPDAFPECPPLDPTLISVGPFGVGCIRTPLIPCPPEGCQEGFACCENGCGSMCVQLENPPPPSPCTQMIVVGTCNEAVPRFGFDAAMGTCRLFMYTGCGGNDNNFETFSECITACVPEICNEPVARGPCPQNIIRWAYDPMTMTCRAFSYGGCGGNENNFVSPSRCFATCFRGLPEVDVCEQPIEEGLCDGNIERFAFNAEIGFCLPLSYGGCGGNENNFATLLECNSRCPPSIPASACLLPIAVGPCGSFIESWGFDIVAGECIQFNYGGCDGNGNRFLTRAACELRCLGQTQQNLCPDGNPPCTIDPCTAAVCPANPAALCTSNLCDVNRQCLAIFADSLGRPVNCDVVVMDPCNEPILRGPCFRQLFNWGYNPSTNQCEMFIYSGCFGNQNNFFSYAACAEQCIGVTDVDVCAQSIAVGSCTDYISSWGFNAQIGECELFSYSGCGGNGNNFRTQTECRSACRVVDVCTLPIDPGPCDGQIERYAFNAVTGQCEMFSFGGCMGNANNFGTMLECAQRCDAGAVPICDQPISPGLCVELVASWGFNSVTGQCEFFLASLCPTSENIFQSFEECAQQCSAPTDRCQQPIQVGDCAESISRWGYNIATRQCQMFSYSGCSGNANSFDTRERCELTCDVMPSPCFPNPCNDGICSVINNAASCNCEATFSFGQICDIPIVIEFQNVASLTIPERNEDTKSICLDPEIPSRSVDVPFSLSASPANIDLNFITSSSIPIGQTCTSIQFSAAADLLLEGTENFEITLSSNSPNEVNVDPNLNQFTVIVTDANPCVPNPCNAGTCSIINNAGSCNCEATFSYGDFCNMPIVIQFQDTISLPIPEGNEGTKSICLGPGIPSRSVDVPFSLSASPANNDLTFSASSSIPMGQTCTSIQFSAVTDGIVEGTETIQISLSSNNPNMVNVEPNLNQFTVIITDANPCVPNPCNAGTCSIINNAASCNCEATFSYGEFCDMPIVIQFQDSTSLTIPEGNEQTKSICLGPGIPSRSVDVPFSLSASPANNDLTFSTSSSIPMGQTCTSIQFSAVTDGIVEGTETIQISLSSNNPNMVNVEPNLNQFTVIITDANPCVPNPCNDGTCSIINNAASCTCEATFSYGEFCDMPIVIQFQDTTSLTIPEGNEQTKSICLGPGIPSRSVDVPFSLSASPATDGLIFFTSSSILMGQTCTSIQFSAVTDGIVEGTETIQISLSSTNPNMVNVDPNLNQFTVFITDDPCVPHPCNDGTCSIINNAASCNCEATFSYGEFCDMPIEIQFQNIASLTIFEGNEGTNSICLDPLIPSRSVDVPFSLSASPSNADLTFPSSSSIPMGQTCTSIQFSAVTDGIQEGAVTFEISLSSNSPNVVNVDPNLNQFTITVTDVEELQFEDITAVSIAEGASFMRNVCLNPPITRNVITIFSLTASPTNSDLNFSPTAVISGDQTCTSVQFSALTDGILEGTESFQISLTSNSVNVAANRDQFTLNVTNVQGRRKRDVSVEVFKGAEECPCKNGGRCVRGEDDWVYCQCTEHFEGQLCQEQRLEDWSHKSDNLIIQEWGMVIVTAVSLLVVIIALITLLFVKNVKNSEGYVRADEKIIIK